MYNINYNKEEEFLSKLIFQNKIISKDYFKSINFEKLTKISSRYLVLPLLFKKIKAKNYKSLIPKKFYSFLKEIYEINERRNLELVKEIEKHANLLNNAKINYVFLKGSALLIHENYKNLERMVGDIDILISQEDFSRAIKLFKKEGFNEINSYNFFQKHYPRMNSNKYIFAIEIHNKLTLKKLKKIDENEFLKSKIKNLNTYIPTKKNMLKHIVYNDQINDNGYILNGYNLKAYYDYFSLNGSKIKKNDNDRYHLNFFFLMKAFTKLEIFTNSGKMKRLRLYLINNYKFFYNLNYFYFKIHSTTKFKIMQINEICRNKKYRKYCRNKFLEIINLQN